MSIPRLLRPVAWIAATCLVAVGACPHAQARGAQAAKPAASAPVITIGYVNWTEAVAVTHLMQAVLENNFRYRVELKLVTPEQAFRGVASGDLDAFLDVWLPETHANYWKKYADQVVDLGSWYQGKATLGLAVPNYVKARSISDLKGQQDRFGGRIIGIQQGAGLMRVTREQAIPAYGLESYTLTSGDTATVIEAIDKAIHLRQPIVFTAWKPHWMFAAYPVRYLDDPKDAYAQVDRIHAIVRTGLKEDAPQAYALLDKFTLTETQLGSLELAVANARSAWGGVRLWLETHQKVIEPWLAAASTKRRDYFRSSWDQ